LATKYDIEMLRKDIELLRLEFKKDLRFWLIIFISSYDFSQSECLEIDC